MPAARMRAMALLLNQDVVLTDLAVVVESDPSLTTAVIRAANSAHSAPIDQVSSAATTIIRLGISGVRRIVVAMILRQQVEAASASVLELDELWRYLLATSLLADAFLWQRGADDTRRSMAFTAGMLHKIGRLAIASESRAEYARVIEAVRLGRLDVDAEREIIGVDHVARAVELCQRWTIPEEIVEAIAGQYSGRGGELAQAVQRGREAALTLGYTEGLTPPVATGPDAASDARDQLGAEERALVAHLGGEEAMRERIEWYRGGLLGSATPPAGGGLPPTPRL